MPPPFSVEADGFQVVPPIVGASVIDSLIEGLAELKAQREAGRTQPRSYGARNLLRDCPTVTALAHSHVLKELVLPVLGAAAFPVRALFFDKLTGANWQVGWHQDLSIAVAERMEVPGFTAWSMKQGVTHVQAPAIVLENMLTLRIHLDDCAEDNGPLRVLRGSHNQGRLDVEQIEGWKTAEEVTCLVPKGGALLMRPLLLHASAPAKNPRHRRVIHVEYAANPLPGGLRWFEQAAMGKKP
jgi:ectoine hydroxylase-related dioxygenase (phytanoyl-CoA dioxygenase family)